MRFGVLGPVEVWDGRGTPVDAKGPRHRAVLARLIAARGRMVPVERLVDDLWESPPEGAVGALRTFVAALRKAVEPDRPPRLPARVLVTEGPGYALRTPVESVDSWRFADEVEAASTAPPRRALELLDGALALWRGPAFAGFEDEPWARSERLRLEGLRLTAIERRADALLGVGRPAAAVPDLEAHTVEHPWREEAWRLLALALFRSDRRADALETVRRAREVLAEQLGLDPGDRLARLETDLLRDRDSGDAATRLWEDTASAFDRAAAADARSRLESTVTLLRGLAVTGGPGLMAAQENRLAAVSEAERLGDPELAARVIGGYDVPANWTRPDDPDRAAKVAGAARRTLAALGSRAHEATRARLLATIAMESRGTADPHAREAAREAEAVARRLGDPHLLAFALNGIYMQAFHRTGLASEREAVATELADLAARHDMPSYAVLSRLLRLQARGALGDFAGAAADADEADALGERYDRPLAGVFTAWFRAMRRAATGAPAEAEEAYHEAAKRLEGSGMPGVEEGLLPLALVCLRTWHGVDPGFAAAEMGPYEPWAKPVLLSDAGREAEALNALDRFPDPPAGLLAEALWVLIARAALRVDHKVAMRRAFSALAPAVGEVAAGSGMVTAGPVREVLEGLPGGIQS
ncbi:BTAD domain-containing putative transcriptional regulator [Salininema proteolyticum]|uniref:BTAD domain-containing putative transcriptional regulator n=1 Tax=Salininema proteolyticum TaxID=1607685 RepID=A0ABV8TUU1_9ACTN